MAKVAFDSYFVRYLLCIILLGLYYYEFVQAAAYADLDVD